jgi:methyltransferase (TIGR00027 family)
MKEGKPSRTAEGMAIHRRMESMKPKDERVCYDPYAQCFLSARYWIIAKSPLLAKFVYWFLAERKFLAAIGEGVTHTRFIDDYLKECLENGIGQLVILGVGYDTRPYRFEELKRKARVFEVDHPDTQKVKTQRLKKLFGSLPDYVVYVSVDFAKEKPGQRLLESGYDGNLKTLFIWEGVTPYLTAEAVDQTLAFVANNSGEGSSIVFNYMYQSVVDGTWNTEEARRHRESVAKLGEPFVFGVKEGTIEDFLSTRGFCHTKNASPEFLERTYFTGANQGRKVCPYIPTVHATVKPRT